MYSGQVSRYHVLTAQRLPVVLEVLGGSCALLRSFSSSKRLLQCSPRSLVHASDSLTHVHLDSRFWIELGSTAFEVQYLERNSQHKGVLVRNMLVEEACPKPP
jgi:hypothetical protein